MGTQFLYLPSFFICLAFLIVMWIIIFLTEGRSSANSVVTGLIKGTIKFPFILSSYIKKQWSK